MVDESSKVWTVDLGHGPEQIVLTFGHYVKAHTGLSANACWFRLPDDADRIAGSDVTIIREGKVRVHGSTSPRFIGIWDSVDEVRSFIIRSMRGTIIETTGTDES